MWWCSSMPSAIHHGAIHAIINIRPWCSRRARIAPSNFIPPFRFFGYGNVLFITYQYHNIYLHYFTASVSTWDTYIKVSTQQTITQKNPRLQIVLYTTLQLLYYISANSKSISGRSNGLLRLYDISLEQLYSYMSCGSIYSDIFWFMEGIIVLKYG